MKRLVLAFFFVVCAIGVFSQEVIIDCGNPALSDYSARYFKKYGDKVADDMTILYGGSCKPSNAKELFAEKDIDGGLIGGAALKADDFLGIATSF